MRTPAIGSENESSVFEGATSRMGAYEMARLLIATSKDLRHWTKKGHAFAKAYKGKYTDTWSKSGSIVSAYKDGKIIATRINGKYWMYWGDQNIWSATSDDLVNWTPVEMDALVVRETAANIELIKAAGIKQ